MFPSEKSSHRFLKLQFDRQGENAELQDVRFVSCNSQEHRSFGITYLRVLPELLLCLASGLAHRFPKAS